MGFGAWVDAGLDALGVTAALARRLGSNLEPLWRLAAPGRSPSSAGTCDPEPETPADASRQAGELPRAYGADGVVLMARDPGSVFAYWEVTPATRTHARLQLADQADRGREVLRVYDVSFLTFNGDNAWHSLDIDILPGESSAHVHGLRPAATYQAELGLRTPGGRFLPLARSNAVITPRTTPSPDQTVRWTDVGTRGTAGVPAR